jgi:hypothetical protein
MRLVATLPWESHFKDIDRRPTVLGELLVYRFGFFGKLTKLAKMR